MRPARPARRFSLPVRSASCRPTTAGQQTVVRRCRSGFATRIAVIQR
ncbi:hypothetical protein [Azospirillum argentinense]